MTTTTGMPDSRMQEHCSPTRPKQACHTTHSATLFPSRPNRHARQPSFAYLKGGGPPSMLGDQSPLTPRLEPGHCSPGRGWDLLQRQDRRAGSSATLTLGQDPRGIKAGPDPLQTKKRGEAEPLPACEGSPLRSGTRCVCRFTCSALSPAKHVCQKKNRPPTHPRSPASPPRRPRTPPCAAALLVQARQVDCTSLLWHTASGTPHRKTRSTTELGGRGVCVDGPDGAPREWQTRGRSAGRGEGA